MAERCYKCFRTQSHCLCEFAKPQIDSFIKFVFLMHPKEARHQRTGTGRLSSLCLKDSKIFVGVDFFTNKEFMDLLNDDNYFPVLMYPKENAFTAKSPDLKEKVKDKKLLVILIDATWFCAKKIIEHNQFLLDLPCFSFDGAYTSIFTFKKEPKPEYISTIESCYYFIKELQEVSKEKNFAFVNQIANPEPLMNVFKEMIKDQLKCENDRIEGKLPNVFAHDWKYREKKEIPDFLE